MTQQRGATAQLNLGFESAFNTIATAGFVMPVNTSNLIAARAKNVAATIRGNRNPDAPFDGYMQANGPIVAPMDSAAMWYWLKAMFGAPTTTGVGPYTHVFKQAALGTQPPLTLEHAYTDITKYYQYTGCKIASWSVEVGGDGELVNNFQIAGANETIATSAFDASATAITISRLKNFQASLEEGGSSFAKGTLVDFNIDFGLDTDEHTIGNNGILGDMPEGILSITGNLEFIFENTTLYDKAVNNTESSLKITVSDGTYSIAIEFPEIEYGRNAPGIPGPQGMRVKLPFNAYYNDDADASAVIVTLINADEHP